MSCSLYMCMVSLHRRMREHCYNCGECCHSHSPACQTMHAVHNPELRRVRPHIMLTVQVIRSHALGTQSMVGCLYWMQGKLRVNAQTVGIHSGYTSGLKYPTSKNMKMTGVSRAGFCLLREEPSMAWIAKMAQQDVLQNPILTAKFMHSISAHLHQLLLT